MSYLNQGKIFFSGKFHADPATLNNTPDNYNPNANFPPANGDEVGNNLQLYWNPNGSGKFALDCTVTKVCDENGDVIQGHQLLGQSLTSIGGTTLQGAKLVDLDPMQQNVTELWGLSLQLGKEVIGEFMATAYSNAWIQVIDGRGDYAGSVQYQSVLTLDNDTLSNSPLLQQLTGTQEVKQNQLSIAFVVRAFNASSLNYLINVESRFAMNNAGVPVSVTDKLTPIELYNQGPAGSGTAGQIPTRKYFTKLVNQLISTQELKQYLATIEKNALLPYIPNTEFDFTYGQVFGTIGLSAPDEPTFMTADRMLTPLNIAQTAPQVQVPTDSGAYSGYFAPFTVSPTGDKVTVNLGNALPSSLPASATNSYVAVSLLGELQLCYFKGVIHISNAVLLGEICYQDNNFYLNDAGLVDININSHDAQAVKCSALGIISTTADSSSLLLVENNNGLYLRANQFVFRMNPGEETTVSAPRGRTQEVEIYATEFGQALANTDIAINLMPSVETATYSFNTLGTGGSSGLVNMGVPTSALSFPDVVTTDAAGIARFTITASDPGNPRGYIDGQIYFLTYGFADPALSANYLQSPDTLISIQVYSQQPDFADITWENFVASTLGLYGKIYPIMGFLDLQDEQKVQEQAQLIYNQINLKFTQPGLMPVTRDLSASRLVLLNRWLCQYF